jgi:hypothetical protein
MAGGSARWKATVGTFVAGQVKRPHRITVIRRDTTCDAMTD